VRRRRVFDLDFERKIGRRAGNESWIAEQEEGRQIVCVTRDIGHERKLRPDA
jgi:hypothetical protein